VRALLAVNFSNWCAAIEECLAAAGKRIPKDVDKKELASFVLTTMEGGVMQARTHRSADTFDAAVRRLRDYFTRMGALPHSKRKKTRPAPTTTRRKR
jgi:TetR/AcrR family transcriptional repressor of nem operon